MHTRHVSLFRWIEANFGGRLYGPYHHGGRHYYQWMARGVFLRQILLPILERRMDEALDAKAFADFVAMKDRYGLGESSRIRRTTPTT